MPSTKGPRQVRQGQVDLCTLLVLSERFSLDTGDDSVYKDTVPEAKLFY